MLKTTIICDRCEVAAITQEAGEIRRGLLNRVDEAGWLSIRQHGSWRNICAACVNEKKAVA